jgi:hypothetical protein
MKNLIFSILFVLLILGVHTSVYTRLRDENRRLKNNQELLLQEKQNAISSSQTYKIADSLNAVKISALELTIKEYKRCHEDDVLLIKQLKSKNANLKSVIDAQLTTVAKLSSALKDSIVVDTINNNKDTIKYFSYTSQWVDAEGYVDLRKDSVSMHIINKENLKVVESVTYKRFLGFLWKTNKVKDHQVSIVSLNPNTVITDFEYVRLSK